MPDVTVVGGGIAGLVVARRLAEAGTRVMLHEASDHLGGTVATHAVGGIALDAGAESFAVRGGAVAALACELGLGDDIVSPRAAPAWLLTRDGSAHPLPATSLLGVPADPRAADVATVVGADAAARAAALDAAPLPERLPDSFGALVRERMGAPVLDLLVAPVVRGVHSMSPDDLPITRAHPGLGAAIVASGGLGPAVARLRADAPAGAAVAGIRGGVHRLVDALAADLDDHGVDVRLGSRVDRADLPALPGRVVLAAPHLAGTPAHGRAVTLVTLLVEQEELDAAPRGTGMLVAADAPGVGARALTHATAKWEWLRERAGGRHVLRLSYDGDADAGVLDEARGDAEVLLGLPLPRIVDAARVVWTRPAPETAPPGALLVGETVAGSGLAGIVAHAERTAAELLV